MISNSKFLACATLLSLALFLGPSPSRAQAAPSDKDQAALGTEGTNAPPAPTPATVDRPITSETDVTAASPTPSPAGKTADSNWHLMVAPYLWLPWVYGTIGANGNNAKFYATPGDLLSHFRFGLLGLVEPRYKRILMPVDMIWLRLGDDRAIGLGEVQTVANIKADMFILTPKIGYRVIDSEKVKIDALAGFRYWHLGQNLQFTTNTLNFSGSQNWVDPLVGGRITGILSPKVELVVAGDVGGWNTGSKLEYQVATALGYRIKPAMALQAGYRYLSINRPNGTRLFDADMSGPFFGVSINLK